eukprot:NP_493409.3 Uncharacterized protein CELE_Y6B3B.4 [Caenorhabditis elegans]
MSTCDKEKAESVVSRSSKKKKNRKKRARQWTGYVENLKTTCDLMYEMCRSEQSVTGCKEAMLYLQSASNDFKSLIETINVEKQWDQDENRQEQIKRPSVAWEVRKSMSSPNPALPISSIIAEAVKNASPPTNKAAEPFPTPSSSNLTYARITAAAAVAAVAVSQPDDGWKLVTNRRRKSTSSTTASEFDREFSVEKEKEPENPCPLNVYERLSSTSYKRTSTRTLTCPKSAMDLPQTRASMAKMAYSRQLLWEKNQQVLVEKLRQRQKREKKSNVQCGFTFADPLAVRKSVEEFNQKKIGSRRQGKETPTTSSNIELHSINEEPTTVHPASSENSEDVPADPTPSSSISQPPPTTTLFGYVQVPEELEKDDEWREMTEEEESLALEENSLNLEIKQAEAMEIDAELERQVEMEADKLEREHRKNQKNLKKEEKKQEKQQEMENFFKVFEEIRSLAWSELMEQESVAQYQLHHHQNVHEPGTHVERHEKMLSPSRRRGHKDDDDFGKRHEMKQKHAEELRQQLQEAKASKLKELTSRVEEVRMKQEALKERKRQLLEARMQRASDNRDKNIMEVIRRAKDDDQRVMEVKFIATLQEDNKRYELLAKDASVEEKQKQLADERARKHEEKAAKKREQEAAATARRAQAAEQRQCRIRKLSEQKEIRHGKKENPAPSAPEDMLQYLNSLLLTEPVNSEPLPYLWPSTEHLAPRQCSLCSAVSTVIHSDLDAISHVLCSKEHQIQAKTLTSGSMIEELKRHFFGIFKEVTVGDGVAIEEKNQREEAMMKAKAFLGKIQLSDSLPAPPSSPRNRTKCVRDFILAHEKLQTNDPKTQEMLEKSLSELVQAVETDWKASTASADASSLNLEQFCAIQGPQKLLEMLLEWTKGGATLRLCIRVCHVFCVFLKDPRVAYAVIFKPELLKLTEKILELVAVKLPQLSALLNVLATCLKSAAQRANLPGKPTKKHQKEQKELQKLDFLAAQAISAVSSFLRNSLSPNDIKLVLRGARGPVLLATRLLGLAEHSGSAELLGIMGGAVLEHTYELKRAGEPCKELVSIVIPACSGILKNRSENCQKLMIMAVILLEDAMWSTTQSILSQGNLEERQWGSLTKDEEMLCKLTQMLGNLADGMEHWQKRCTMISWTGGRSSCLHILINHIPIRLLSIGKHASRLVPTVAEKLMDRLTNAEKSEILGDMAAGWFFENSMFPGRT